MRVLPLTLAALLFLQATACGSSGGSPGDGGVDFSLDSATCMPADPPTLGGCRIFPPDNPWNQDVSGFDLHPLGGQISATMAPGTSLHPDWGNWSDDHYGIPWQSGSCAEPMPITWTLAWGEDESDPLACTIGGTTYPFCYPIPLGVRIEGGPGAPNGADRHVLYLDTNGAPNDCTLYELYLTRNVTGPGFTAGNGAIFHLGSNALRPDGWTSADAAGLPILPGLVRYDEVAAGEIRHALRFTMSDTAEGYIHPATHQAGDPDPYLPPMGLRVRLRDDYSIVGASTEAQVILQAMKTYGMLLADNGSDWYVTGDSDDRWDAILDGIIDALDQVQGSDFEIVDTGPTLP